MSLTKVTYSMIEGAVANVLDFGADPTGAASSTTAIQTAVDSLTNGGVVYFPQGTYLLNVTNGVTLDNNIALVGDGPATIIKFGAQDSLTAVSKTNVEIRNIKFKNENYRVYFNKCTNVQLIDCHGDGLITAGNITQQGFWFAGCNNVLIQNPTFVNYRDCIYLSADDWPTGTNPCGRVSVVGGSIIQTNHGTGMDYPTGVYGFQVQYLYVDGVYFQDIKPSAGSTGTGYGVYEGDGTLGNLTLVQVSNCIFKNVDAATTAYVGILTSVARDTVVDTCYFQNVSTGFWYGSQNTKINNCVFDNSQCISAPTIGVPQYDSFVATNNYFFNNSAGTGLIVQNDNTSGNLGNALIANNYFKNIDKGALWLRFVDFAAVTDNYFEDCNVSGDANDYFNGGINFFGCTAGLVDGNTIIRGTLGNNGYGITSAATTHAINITPNNRIIGSASVLRPLTAPPTIGIWSPGQYIHNWSPAAGGTPGWVCVTYGTPGTWKAMANLVV